MCNTHYLDVYTYEKWNGRKIPKFSNEEQITPSKLYLSEGKTTAPELLSEADLIGLMDKVRPMPILLLVMLLLRLLLTCLPPSQSGIGTDATVHAHIETIQTRKYAEQVGQRFAPTTLGLALTSGYTRMKALDAALSKVSAPSAAAAAPAAPSARSCRYRRYRRCWCCC